MSDLNKVFVLGRLTKDIGADDFKYTSNGKACLKFSVASSDGYGDSKYTNYFDVVVWGKPAEALKQYLCKGKQVVIDGRLRQERWESNGQKRSRVSIVADNVQMLGGKTESTASDSGSYQEDIPF